MVVRLLIGDDPQQRPIAERALQAALAAGGVCLPEGVLAEDAWVLRGTDLARRSRHDARRSRHDLLNRLLRTRGAGVNDSDAVIEVLERFRQAGDQADQLILACASRAGALPVLSVDRRFGHRIRAQQGCGSAR